MYILADHHKITITNITETIPGRNARTKNTATALLQLLWLLQTLLELPVKLYYN